MPYIAFKVKFTPALDQDNPLSVLRAMAPVVAPTAIAVPSAVQVAAVYEVAGVTGLKSHSPATGNSDNS
jgi:hypothetical protein